MHWLNWENVVSSLPSGVTNMIPKVANMLPSSITSKIPSSITNILTKPPQNRRSSKDSHINKRMKDRELSSINDL